MPSCGEMLRGPKQVNCHKFVAVEGQIVPKENSRETIERRGTDKPQDHTAYRFQDAVDSFERDSGAEALVEKPFVPIPYFGRHCLRMMNLGTPSVIGRAEPAF